jgi:hypothetical protein
MAVSFLSQATAPPLSDEKIAELVKEAAVRVAKDEGDGAFVPTGQRGGTYHVRI